MSVRHGLGRVAFGCLFVVVGCLVFIALAWALVLTGEVSLYGPRVIGIEPVDGSPLLPTFPLTLTFDQPMDPASVQAAFSFEPDVSGTFHWNDNHTQMTFVPDGQGYELGTIHTFRLAAGAKGGTLPRSTEQEFEGSFYLPPLLDAQSPLPGEVGSGPWPVFQALFNYAVDCDATLQTFSISPDVAGLLECGGRDGGSHALAFSPTLPLEPGTAYVAELATVYLEKDGWARPGVRWELDTAPPLTVVDASPAEGASLTDLWTPVRITFSRPVVADSALKRFSLNGQDGHPLPGQVIWGEGGADLVFQPEQSLAPDAEYRFSLDPGVLDELGFRLAEPVARSFETEPMLGIVSPQDGATSFPLDGVVRIHFAWPMDGDSVEAGFSLTPPVEGGLTWDDGVLQFAPSAGFAPETQYQIALSGDIRDASGARLVNTHRWSFTTGPFLLGVEPSSGANLTKLQQRAEFTFALPMDRASVQASLVITPETPGELVWGDHDRVCAFQPNPAWVAGADYQVTLSGSARTAEGSQTLGEDHVLTFSTDTAVVQFGEGPNVQVMDAAGERTFQLVFRGADVADFRLYAISSTQFLDLYSSGFRGIGPEEPQLAATFDLTPTVEWREVLLPLSEQAYGEWQVAEAHLPVAVPPGLYALVSPSFEEGDGGEPENSQLLVFLTRHGLVLKQALTGYGSGTQAQIVAWDTELSGGSPVVSATVRLYDRDGSFLAEGATDADGLLALDVPGEPGPLMALAEKDGDYTVCGLGNEWGQGAWWWFWAQPPSRPRYTVYAYTDRPIYRPAQTIYFKEFLRTNDDVSYTLPAPDLPVTVRLRDARDNVAATQVLTPSAFGTVHGQFHLDDEPMLGTWNLETEVDGNITRQPFKVEEYRKPEYEVVVRTPQKAYVYGEAISMTVDANYYFGQAVAGAEVTMEVYSAYSGDYYADDGPQFGYPLLTKRGLTDAQGRWTAVLPTEGVFSSEPKARRAMLVLEVTVTDDSGQSVSSYQIVFVQRASVGLTLLLEREGYKPDEEIAFAAQMRDLDGEPVVGAELTAQVVGWDEQEVATAAGETDASGWVHFSVSLADQGWYYLYVNSTDEGGREVQVGDHLWVYDPTGRAPWYQGRWGQQQILSVSADRTSYAVGDLAQLVVYTPVSGAALLTFERGETRYAEPITLISGTNLITVPIRADFAPNVHVAVSQFGPLDDWWFEQSRPEGQMNQASTQLLVPMPDRRLTLTLGADEALYAPGDEVSFQVQVTDYQGRPVVAEVSMAVVDEAIYALAEDMSADPFDLFYAPRPNMVRTFDSLKPARWLYPEGPGLGGGDGEAGEAPRHSFFDTAYWAPTILTDESGQASITFQLPDNLTEWRAMARAITTDTLVGQDTARVVVGQDIVVRPALPRFLVQGDVATLSFVVSNFSAQAVSATVQVELDGLAFVGEQVGETGQVVHVPRGGSTVAGWLVRAEAAGEARITARATATYSGARLAGRDAVEVPLPIQPLAVPEIISFAGDLTPSRPRATMTITLPSDAIEGLSRLEINLAPSVAPGLLQGLEYLIDFPFG